jgi:hypothetical protein
VIQNRTIDHEDTGAKAAAATRVEQEEEDSNAMELDGGEEVVVFPVYDMRIQSIDTVLQSIQVAGHQLLLEFEFFNMRNLFALHGASGVVRGSRILTHSRRQRFNLFWDHLLAGHCQGAESRGCDPVC